MSTPTLPSVPKLVHRLTQRQHHHITITTTTTDGHLLQAIGEHIMSLATVAIPVTIDEIDDPESIANIETATATTDAETTTEITSGATSLTTDTIGLEGIPNMTIEIGDNDIAALDVMIGTMICSGSSLDDQGQAGETKGIDTGMIDLVMIGIATREIFRAAAKTGSQNGRDRDFRCSRPMRCP